MPQPNNPCSYEFPQKLLNHQSSLPSGSNGWRIMLKPSVLPRTQDDLWMQTEAIEGVGKEVNILCILSRQVQRISTKFFCIFLYNLLFQPCAVHAVCVTAWHETLQIHWGHRWKGNLAMNHEWDLTQKRGYPQSYIRTLKKQLSFFPTSNHFTMRIWVIRLFGTSICWLTVRYVSRIKPGRGMTARLAPAVSNSVYSSTVNA